MNGVQQPGLTRVSYLRLILMENAWQKSCRLNPGAQTREQVRIKKEARRFRRRAHLNTLFRCLLLLRCHFVDAGLAAHHAGLRDLQLHLGAGDGAFVLRYHGFAAHWGFTAHFEAHSVAGNFAVGNRRSCGGGRRATGSSTGCSAATAHAAGRSGYGSGQGGPTDLQIEGSLPGRSTAAASLFIHPLARDLVRREGDHCQGKQYHTYKKQLFAHSDNDGDADVPGSYICGGPGTLKKVKAGPEISLTRFVLLTLILLYLRSDKLFH